MMKKNVYLLILLLVLGILPMSYATYVSINKEPYTDETELSNVVSVETPMEEQYPVFITPTDPGPSTIEPKNNVEEDNESEFYTSDPSEIPDTVSHNAPSSKIIVKESRTNLESLIGIFGTINSALLGWLMLYFNCIRKNKKT